MDSLSLSLAFLAGNLAAVNPCGFAMLPAFLSFYVGAEETTLPSIRGRLAQGLVVGLTVTVAFLAVFTLVGVPLALGATVLARAAPWAAITVGAALAVLGVYQLLGRHLTIPSLGGMISSRGGRHLGSFFLFGVAYAVSSLGCTLPVFLAAVGSSFATSGPLGGVAVFAAYGAGMGTLVVALAVSAALLRTGLTKAMRRLMPYLSRVTGFLLLVGIYLIAYWGSALAGPAFLDNPAVELGARASSTAENWLLTDAGRWFVIGAGALVLAALAVTLIRSLGPSGEEEQPEPLAQGSRSSSRP